MDITVYVLLRHDSCIQIMLTSFKLFYGQKEISFLSTWMLKLIYMKKEKVNSLQKPIRHYPKNSVLLSFYKTWLNYIWFLNYYFSFMLQNILLFF